MSKEYSIENISSHWAGRFNAMACPCEILIDTNDKELADMVTRIAFDEAKRIEFKFSRSEFIQSHLDFYIFLAFR